MGYHTVNEESYNKYYEKYDDQIEEVIAPLETCVGCKKLAESVNRVKECSKCEMKNDSNTVCRLDDLELYQMENVELVGDNFWYYNGEEFIKILV